VCDLAAMPPTLTSTHGLPGMAAGQLSCDGAWLAWANRGDVPLIRLSRLGSADEGVRMGWDLEERFVGLCFSPDGQTLAAVGEDGTIKLVPWRLVVG